MNPIRSVLDSDRLRTFLHSRAGVVLVPAHVAAVLRVATGLRDHKFGRPDPDPRLAGNVTIAVKTFNRPRSMSRFARSVRRVFGGRIVVADDSRRTWRTRNPLISVLALPFNSGVARGRNAALAEVRTPYVLVADDDEVFTRATDWSRALDYLERHSEVDGVAGVIVELPRLRIMVTEGNPLFPGHRPPLRQPGEEIDGLPVRLKVPQTYLARTESIRRIGWDQNLRMVDHNDFFSRASGSLVFVQDPAIPVYHSRTPWKRDYTRYRNDTSADFAYLAQKWPG